MVAPRFIANLCRLDNMKGCSKNIPHASCTDFNLNLDWLWTAILTAYIPLLFHFHHLQPLRSFHPCLHLFEQQHGATSMNFAFCSYHSFCLNLFLLSYDVSGVNLFEVPCSVHERNSKVIFIWNIIHKTSNLKNWLVLCEHIVCPESTIINL